MGPSLLAFDDGIDEALIFWYGMGSLVYRNVPLRALTDRSSLFSIIIRPKKTTERHVMIDLRAASEAFEKRENA